MVQLLPESVNKLWNKWDVRIMVVSSLCLQIILTIFGSRRKYISRNWIRVVTWVTYLSADWVATVALGMISNFQGDDQAGSSHPNSMIIMAFWAPFLLVHLGGPDTITAYALEDNELWLRHLLGLIVQVAVAFHIFLKFWTSSTYNLSVLALPIFVAGILKYGERTWVLWSASREKFSNTVDMSHSNGGPDNNLHFESVDPQAKLLLFGHELFKNIVRHLYLNLSIDRQDVKLCYDVLCGYSSKDSEDVFKLMEVELGFMYDVLYTKATIVHSIRGIIFRSTTLFCYISTFVVFCIHIDKQLYYTIDVTLTYLLSAGAIVLELYSIIVLVFTDWTLYWLISNRKHTLADRMYKVISSSFPSKVRCNKRWSNTLAQYNLIDVCLKVKGVPKHVGIKKLIGICEKSEKYWFMTFEDVSKEMKLYILTQLQDARALIRDGRSVKEVLTRRGSQALQDRNCLEQLSWTVTGPRLPFHKSILYWHIATDICYYHDVDTQGISPTSKMSKLLSDYMAYILVMRPFMLPKGIGQISVRDTCSHAIAFCKERRRLITNRKDARRVLLQEESIVAPSGLGKSVLSEGCRLARHLQLLDTENGWNSEEKWKMITQVWVELLCYAASECGWEHHAQQLRRGGELLTHICLLMAHLGLSEQLPRGKPS
ncbi:hypothetical protein ACLB2K_000415 [Fragaria x ananassa]